MSNNIVFLYQIGTFIWMCLVPWKKRLMMFKQDYENHLYIAANHNSNDAFHGSLRAK